MTLRVNTAPGNEMPKAEAGSEVVSEDTLPSVRLFVKTSPVFGVPLPTDACNGVPLWKAVLWSIVVLATPSYCWYSRPTEPPLLAKAPMSYSTLFWTRTRCSCWLELLLSHPSMWIPAVVWRTMLWVNVTSRTSDQGAPPFWLRGVKTMANPSWSACFQLFSKMLPSMRTRWAFFSSKIFLTIHGVPAYAGSPTRQASCLLME